MKAIIAKSFVAALMIFVVLFAAGCVQSQKIADIKNSDHLGKTVTVSGTVQKTLKIGAISGYTLKDSAGDTIAVSSETLPKEGSSMTVTGVLTKGTVFDYYIQVT
jgi:ATP-dependent Lon protease